MAGHHHSATTTVSRLTLPVESSAIRPRGDHHEANGLRHTAACGRGGDWWSGTSVDEVQGLAVLAASGVWAL